MVGELFQNGKCKYLTADEQSRFLRVMQTLRAVQTERFPASRHVRIAR